MKRPLSVRECKRLIDNRMDKIIFPSPDVIYPHNLNKSLSSSTPNINNMNLSTTQLYSTSKHNLDAKFPQNDKFKTSSLSRYDSQDSLVKNRILSKQHSNSPSMDKINSLDRFSTLTRSTTSSNVIHDKPFYPPGKYSNIHDKSNLNLQRLLETRRKYQTPESRRSLPNLYKKPQKIVKNRNQSPTDSQSTLLTKSVPNKFPNNISNNYHYKIYESNNENYNLKLRVKSTSYTNQDQMDYSPEINVNRICKRFDIPDKTRSQNGRPLSVNFQFPNAIPNPFFNEIKEKQNHNIHFKPSIAVRISSPTRGISTNLHYHP